MEAIPGNTEVSCIAKCPKRLHRFHTIVAKFVNQTENYGTGQNKSPGEGLSFLRIGTGVTALVLLPDLFLFCFNSGFLFGAAQTCISNGCDTGE